MNKFLFLLKYFASGTSKCMPAVLQDYKQYKCKAI